MPSADLEQQVRLLLDQGQKIEAVKVYKDQTGASLAEAKEAIEAMQAGAGPPSPPEIGGDLEAELLRLLEAGEKTEACKLYRNRMGVALIEAKLGRRGPGAVLDLGVAGDGPATEHHLDELGEVMDDLDHERYMRRAIELAANVPDVPFGAVIVDRSSGQIVAEGWNKSSVKSNVARRNRRHQSAR
jgi:ribosomal protein L7/L12